MTTDFASRGTLYFEDALGRNTALPGYPQGNQRLGYSQFLGKCGLRGFPAAQECLEVHKRNITIRDFELQEFYYDSSVLSFITTSNNYLMEHEKTWRDRIKAALKQKKLDQDWLAEKIGIAQPTVSAKLNAKRGASLEEINAMADALGLNRAWVTHGEPKDGSQAAPAAHAKDEAHDSLSKDERKVLNAWQEFVRMESGLDKDMAGVAWQRAVQHSDAHRAGREYQPPQADPTGLPIYLGIAPPPKSKSGKRGKRDEKKS